MKELINIKYWIFDLDNTLYSGDTKVFDQVDKKMSKAAGDANKKMEDDIKIKKAKKSKSIKDLPTGTKINFGK